jgi:lambda family phage portal protein
MNTALIPQKRMYGLPPRRHNFIAGTSRRGGYDAARVERLFDGWTTQNVSTNSYLRTELLRIRTRSRDLARNDDYHKGFLRHCKTNIVGPNGFTLQMNVANGDGNPDEEANDAIEAAWQDFSKKENFTVTGKHTRVDAENLLLGTCVRDGEFLYREVKGFKGNPHRYAIQPISPDFLDEEKNEVLPNGNKIIMGVETDRWDRAVNYWLRTFNPGDIFSFDPNGYKTVPVPASEIKHLFLFDDFDQKRGVPWIHAGQTRLKMLNGFEEAALEDARGAACQNTYFTQTLDANGEYKGDRVDAEGNVEEDMEPGQKRVLPLGMGVQHVDPTYPNVEFGQFVKSILRGICTGLGVSYNSLCNDLEGVNFSSIRAGLLSERDMWKLLQVWWANQIEVDIFKSWLEIALLAGQIKSLKTGRPLAAVNFEKYNKPLFFGRRWDWVDPEKDVKAATMAVQNGFKSRAQYVAEQSGRDLEDVYKEMKRDKDLQKKYELNFDQAAKPAPTEKPPAEATPEEKPEE